MVIGPDFRYISTQSLVSWWLVITSRICGRNCAMKILDFLLPWRHHARRSMAPCPLPLTPAAHAHTQVATGPRDCPVGETLELALVMRDHRGKAFTRFDDLPLKWKLQHPDLFVPLSEAKQRSSLRALQPGSSSVEVTFTPEIDAKTFISAFKPLSLYPPHEPLLLAIGSSLVLNFTDGPTKIHSYASEYNASAAAEGDLVAVTKVHLAPGMH